MKKILAIMLAALTLLMLCACGSKSSTSPDASYYAPAYDDGYYYDEAYYGEAPMAMAEEAREGYWAEETNSSGSSQADVPPDMGNVKMIYTASVDMESTDFDEAVQAIGALTAECGGYYESSSMSDRGNSRSASFTVRVPADKYRTFLEKAGSLCHVTYQQESAEDVSETYYDTAGRLETQKTKLARLQELLSEATRMDDIITIENEISYTEENIDRLSGTLRHYDALVAYSTVVISLREVKVLTEITPVTESFGTRFANAFKGGLQDFAEALGDIAVALAYSWLWLFLIAAIVVVILLATKKKRAERRQMRLERKNAPPAPIPSYSKPQDKEPLDKTE